MTTDGVFGVEVYPFPFPFTASGVTGVTGGTSVACVRCVMGCAGGTGCFMTWNIVGRLKLVGCCRFLRSIVFIFLFLCCFRVVLI